MTLCQKLLKQEGSARIESMQQSSATPSLHLGYFFIPTSYFIFTLVYILPCRHKIATNWKSQKFHGSTNFADVYFSLLMCTFVYNLRLEALAPCGFIIHCTDCHQWLLGDGVDILPSLLLPLAGPEEFSEEETAKLPEDLQYLPDDKTREEDPDVRKMLLEALTKVM